MNIEKISVVGIVVGVVGLALVGILSALGAAAFLNPILGSSALSSAAGIFGTLVVLGAAGFAADYLAHNILHWW